MEWSKIENNILYSFDIFQIFHDIKTNRLNAFEFRLKLHLQVDLGHNGLHFDNIRKDLMEQLNKKFIPKNPLQKAQLTFALDHMSWSAEWVKLGDLDDKKFFLDWLKSWVVSRMD